MRTPKFTGNASINYAHKFEQGEITAYVGGNYNSGMSFDPNNRIRQNA